MFIDPDAVERHLAGKRMLFSLAEAARTVGLAPDYITIADWRRLASILLSLGCDSKALMARKFGFVARIDRGRCRSTSAPPDGRSFRLPIAWNHNVRNIRNPKRSIRGDRAPSRQQKRADPH